VLIALLFACMTEPMSLATANEMMEFTQKNLPNLDIRPNFCNTYYCVYLANNPMNGHLYTVTTGIESDRKSYKVISVQCLDCGKSE